MGAGHWQLLDRPTEHEAIRSALHGETRGVVLGGPAGVGKTTLARMVTNALPAKVHWAACTESSRDIPLGAFAQWVRQTNVRDPVALLGSARDALFGRGETIVGVDDAHLLDQLSATLVHHVAVERLGPIVATVRSGEAVPPAVTSLWKDGYLQRFDIKPLTKAQSIQLIQKVLGATLEGLSADVLWQASGGNPLFLRYSVEGALETGALRSVDGVWQLRGHSVVSSGLAALLEERLNKASEEALSALRLLALCEPLDIATLSSLVGDDAVDAAEMQGLIRISQDGPVVNARISHPMYGDVLRRRIGTASARTLRGRIAQALRDGAQESAADRIRLAQLFIDSDQAVDPALLVTAAKDAVFLANLPAGERLARRAVDAGAGVRAAELLSRALMWQGKPAEADRILAQFDPDDLDELELVQWGVPRLSVLFWAMGSIERAHDLLALLFDRVTHPALRRVMEATRAAMTVHENNIVAGIAEAETVLADADSPRQAVEFAAFAAGLVLGPAGRGMQFESIAARCRSDQKPTDGLSRAMIWYGDVLSLVHTGQLELAAERVAGYTGFTSTGQFTGWAIARISDGLLQTYRGLFPAAISSIEQALAALNAETSLPWRLPARILLARAYAGIGNAEQAERVLSEANEHTGRQVAVHQPALTIARSCAAAARGSDHTAVDLARTAANQARRTHQFAVEAEALHHAARFGDRTVAPRLAALAKVVEGPAVGLQWRHATALADADPGALDEVSVAFTEAGFLSSAADAAAQAAVLHDIGGRRRSSADSLGRAVALAAACGEITSPALRLALRPLPLSEREREIAMLVAEGLSNREIAQRLIVSVRTVEGHIYRACTKLDISDREDLAAIVRSSK